MFAAKQNQRQPFSLSPIKEIELRAAAIPGAISLAQGIPSLSSPEVVREFAAQKLREGKCDRYSLTHGLVELRDEIALSLESEGLQYDPEREIIITAGSLEGVTAALFSATVPGDEVLVPSPIYASFLNSIALAGCKPVFVPLQEEKNFDLDVRAIERAVNRSTRVILLCIPNNPTGTVYSESQIRELVALAERRDLILLIDEVYKDFYYDDDIHFSPAHVLSGRDRIIRACSFSKAYAMTGWRVGFLAFDSVHFADLVKVHDTMVSCAPVVSQYGALAALRLADEVRQEYVHEFRKRRDYTIQFLDDHSRVLDYQEPKATYFAFPRIKDRVPLARNSAALASDILEQAKVAFVPGAAFGPSGEGHLRINFGRDWDDLQRGLERFGNYLSRQSGAGRSPSKAAENTPVSSPLRTERSWKVWLVQQLARCYLFIKRPRVIGIFGIQGKTAIKRAITEQLQAKIALRSNPRSFNSSSGLPLAILGIEAASEPTRSPRKIARMLRQLLAACFHGERYLVLEYGYDTRAEIDLLLSIARPSFAVVSPMREIEPGIDPRTHEYALERVLEEGPEAVLVSESDQFSRSILEPLSTKKVVHLIRIKETDARSPTSPVSRSQRFGELVSDELEGLIRSDLTEL